MYKFRVSKTVTLSKCEFMSSKWEAGVRYLGSKLFSKVKKKNKNGNSDGYIGLEVCLVPGTPSSAW